MLSSENDYEIRRTIWDSRIPVEFVLDDSEPSSRNRSQPSIFMMLPRVSYFSLYLDEPIRTLHGNELQDGQLSNAWLLHNGEMLKWHYPIGVLFDMYANADQQQTLPWLIAIRLKDFPDELIRCISRDQMKFNFIQTIKEASQIKHKRNVASAMTKEEHTRLFDSLIHDRFNEFWSINEKLMANEESRKDGEQINVPIRFYQRSFPFRQLLMPVTKKDENGVVSDTTLAEAILKIFPEQTDMDRRTTAISHGIELPLSTSIGWMARNLSYPDNFLHVVVVQRTD